MIIVENLYKTYRVNGTRRVVCDGINARFPTTGGVAIFGRNGAGKSTFLRIISGRQAYDSGRIIRQGTISWPIGFTGSFHPDLTGAQNVRFVARIQGVDTDELVAYVQDFAELGQHFHLPVRTYSSGMRGRLAFGISMGIRFDTYIADESTATGDEIFRSKAVEVFRDRMKECGVIMVTHSIGTAKEVCKHGGVLENGKLHYFDDVNDAIAMHMDNVRRQRALSGRGDDISVQRAIEAD